MLSLTQVCVYLCLGSNGLTVEIMDPGSVVIRIPAIGADPEMQEKFIEMDDTKLQICLKTLKVR